ncbi:hypothetical protein BTR25_00510 [Bacillus sp. MRMR6]|nr:hypothetical protein BTR25_00510 [Bacillus sp. MRMR6]
MEKGYFFTGFPGFICNQLIREVLKRNQLKGVIYVLVSLTLGKWFLSIKPIRRYLGVEKEALDYFTWMGKFDNTLAANDLKGSGIRCPDFKEGIRPMTAFYLKQKDNPNYQIRIL